jgi:hypothetical protein
MADAITKTGGAGAVANSGVGSSGVGKGKGVKPSVVDTLTGPQRFARKQMQQARAALVQCQRALENGTDITPEIVDACGEIVKLSGRMLFAK